MRRKGRGIKNKYRPSHKRDELTSNSAVDIGMKILVVATNLRNLCALFFPCYMLRIQKVLIKYLRFLNGHK